ncbi:MAG: ribonuclease protein subunit [Thermoplasmata archaeon]|jgi:ribonuclease P protein subunit POP4|nr:ribonuclease protein subunit [Thermoplasmata archaeon]
MKRTIPRLQGAARAVARGELVGLAARVVQCTDPGLVGLSGVVVDETLRTLVVRRPDGREARIGKRGCHFELSTKDWTVVVDGGAIEFRPEDRTKKVK